MSSKKPLRRAAGSVRRALVAIALAGLGACSATGYSVRDLAESINATRHVGAAVLQAGDMVKLTFLTKSEWNQEVRLRADGKGAFLGLDDVALAGLTLAQADELLTGLYAKVNTDTPVERPLSIDLVGAAGGPAGGGAASAGAAYVVGEVHTPGPIALVGPTLTITDAIAAAGGHLKQSANLRNVVLVRRLASGEMRSWRLDLDIYEWGALPAVYLQPRDVVFVPNTAVDEVNIWVDKYIRQNIPLPYLLPPM